VVSDLKNIKFVYFDGCPNADVIEGMLIKLNVDFEKIEQTALLEGNKFKQYTSPTVILGDEIIFGASADGGGCSLNLPSIEFFKEKLL